MFDEKAELNHLLQHAQTEGMKHIDRDQPSAIEVPASEDGEIPAEKKARLQLYEQAFDLGTFPLQGNAIGFAWSKDVAANQLLKENYDRVGKKQAAQRELWLNWA